MPKHKEAKCLLDVLDQLAECGKISDFIFPPDIGSLPAGEREAALRLKKALDNFKSAAEYDLMRYRLAGESLGVGYWDITITGTDMFSPDNKFVCSNEIHHLLGYGDDFGGGDFSDTLANWLGHLHWDDRDRVVAAFMAHMADRTGKTPLDEECRMMRKSGEFISVRVFGTALRDNTGAPIRVAGAVDKITEASVLIRQANEQAQLMLDAAPLAITMWDKDFRVVDCSQTALDVFGFSSKRELIEHFVETAPEYQPCGRRSLEVLAEAATEAFQTGSCHLEWTGVTKSGEPIIFEDTAVRVKYKNEYALMLYSRDIREEKKTLAALDAANEAKSAFLAQMSHEMRTPLSAVISLSELVLENGGLNQDNEVYLDKIYNAGSTLLCIVNDILDISKIEAGKFEIIPQEYDVPNMINETVAQNILRIHSKPVRFTLNVDEDMPMRLRGDDIRVKQIVSNLLSNAFKYTDKGTVELSVDFERDGGDGDSVWTKFRVSDTGVGIKPADLNRLFTDYSRFDGEANRKIGGTGLGLSITKRLAELMDGEITAKSEHGKGSVFTVRIRQQYVNDAVIGSEMAEHLRNFLYTTSKRRSGAQLNRVSVPYARVLVVDDNRTNLDIAKGLMRPYGMDIDCVTDGQSAVDILREGKDEYDAIFMDHMMPGMDGVEAVRIIREEIGSAYAKSVPIIALTANALAGSKERFISQGFSDFVSKPIDIFRLDSVIRKWIWDEKRQRGDSHVYVARGQQRDRRKGGDRRKGDRRAAHIPMFSEVIEGLDWTRGIELFGSVDSFRQVLESFAVNTKPLLDTIRDVNAGALPRYEITVHGLKSSSRGVCAYALGSAAESLEFAAKDGNLDFINIHNPDFLAAAQKLIADIEAILDKAAKSDVKPQKDRPGDEELTRLRSACEDFNMDEIEAVMREIERCEYTADDGLAGWLRDNIARLNYTGVIEKITRVVQRR